MKKMYFVYLDESGDSRFRKGIREEDDFFILGGVLVKEKHLEEINQKFKEFKESNFPEEFWNYPIHAVELNQISRHRKTAYKGKISESEGKELLKKTYQLINTFPIEAIVVLIDKYELKQKYITPFNPYDIAYEILCEKVQKIVDKRNEPDNNLVLMNLAECLTKPYSTKQSTRRREEERVEIFKMG